MTAIICGISTTELQPQEIKTIQHPLICGIILFKRNYENYNQLKLLVAEIKCIGGEDFIICVDQEGGRVIRLGQPFSQLPALGEIGKIHSNNKELARSFAHMHAWLMCSELLSIGIDISYAPVLDIDNGSNVIGDRSFSSSPELVAELCGYYCRSMHDAGMTTTAKHFPGHGTVVADSHFDLPIDSRAFTAIEKHDLLPFIQLIKQQHIDSVMMSHVIYTNSCDQAAGYSKHWCQNILRQKYGFKGIIISDDLGMKAADCVGNVHARYQACIDSGIDIALACTSELTDEILSNLPNKSQKKRFPQLKGHPTLSINTPFWQNSQWKTIRKSMDEIIAQAELYHE